MRTTAIFCLVTLITFVVFAIVQILQWTDEKLLTRVLPQTVYRKSEKTSFGVLNRPTEIMLLPEMNPRAYRCSSEDPKPTAFRNLNFTLDSVVNTSVPVMDPDAPFENIVKTRDRDYLARSNFSSVQFASVPEHYFSERHLLTNVIFSRWSNSFDRQRRRKELRDLTKGAIRPVFVVGLPKVDDQKPFCSSYDECINWLLSEQLASGDMLILNLTDQYDLISMKTTGVLQWVTTLVPEGPEFVMKSDEDVIINYSTLVEDVIRRFPNGFKTFVYDGCLWWPWAMPVVHNKKHKNFEDVGFDWYPAYNSGPAYILSSLAAKELYKVRTSTITQYFNNEDAMLGILTHFTPSNSHPVNDRKVYPIGAPGVGLDCTKTPSEECTCQFWWAIQCIGSVKCEKVKKAAELCSVQRAEIFEQLDSYS